MNSVADSAHRKFARNSQRRGCSTDFDSRPVPHSNTPRLRIQRLSFRVTRVSRCFAHSARSPSLDLAQMYRYVLVANDVSRNSKETRERETEREREWDRGTRVIVICFPNVSQCRRHKVIVPSISSHVTLFAKSVQIGRTRGC